MECQAVGEGPLLPGYRQSQTYWLSCPEAPKPSSSLPAGGSTSLSLTLLRKPRPRAHGPACSEGLHGSWGGGGLPHGLPCSCVELGEAGWVLSHIARQDSKKDQILGHIGHPRSPISGDAGRPWLGCVRGGRHELSACSQSQEPCISLPGGQAEAMGMATTGNTGQGASVAGPLLAALALGTVWPAMTPLQRRE